MTDAALKTMMLNRLLRLRDHGPEGYKAGICGYAVLECYGTGRGAGKRAFSLLIEAMRGWSEHSGDEAYPVPYYRGDGNPVYGYHITRDLWDKHTEYGRARWRLVDFLIEELKK